MTDKHKRAMPKRIQLRRTKGWRMPPNTVSVARPHKHGNPFRIGDYHKIGDGRPGMSRIQALSAEHADDSYTLIETNEQAVAMFREWRSLYPISKRDLDDLRGKNLACFCKLGTPCHADVLLELANAEDAP